MKRTALLITAALLASPAFAADLCSDNLQKIDAAVQSNAGTAQTQDQAMRLQEKAIQAQQSGDTKACIAQTEKALKLLKQSGKS
ncbi:hypothetical protein ACYCAX_21445 [Pseudomonas sp. MT3]|uniref:hypothetical protein n=1 Tax=Pseudomonas sp. ATCC 13867 TaxID=1294143 RepID=UPI0002C4F078|nr:hypothetical protein [Pseudomonas sp. ATCC 13867]AGI26110.1 hypothetical protein H681_21215 [Pseudomonas sp. ATCC 13867]RFQ27101.1 hypothetical protein D0N87_18930 [Pseudomonas sp. ATCC 13867]